MAHALCLNSTSTPFTLRAPSHFRHGPSPLSRFARDAIYFERCSTWLPLPPPPEPYQDYTERRLSTPPDSFESVDPPPPYVERSHVPFASFYVLSYHDPQPPPPRETSPYTHHGVMDSSMDDNEVMSLSSEYGDAMDIDEDVEKWATPNVRHRLLIKRKERDAWGGRQLARLRLEFVAKHIPNLSTVLVDMWRRRYRDDETERFFVWYESLPVDRRLKEHPTFELARYLSRSKRSPELNSVDSTDISKKKFIKSPTYAPATRSTRERRNSILPPQQATIEPLVYRNAHLAVNGVACNVEPHEVSDEEDLVRRWYQIMPNCGPPISLREQAMNARWVRHIKRKKRTDMNKYLEDRINFQDLRRWKMAQHMDKCRIEFEASQFPVKHFSSSWHPHIENLPGEHDGSHLSSLRLDFPVM